MTHPNSGLVVIRFFTSAIGLVLLFVKLTDEFSHNPMFLSDPHMDFLNVKVLMYNKGLLKTVGTIGIVVKDQSSHLVYLNTCIKSSKLRDNKEEEKNTHVKRSYVLF